MAVVVLSGWGAERIMIATRGKPSRRKCNAYVANAKTVEQTGRGTIGTPTATKDQADHNGRANRAWNCNNSPSKVFNPTFNLTGAKEKYTLIFGYKRNFTSNWSAVLGRDAVEATIYTLLNLTGGSPSYMRLVDIQSGVTATTNISSEDTNWNMWAITFDATQASANRIVVKLNEVLRALTITGTIGTFLNWRAFAFGWNGSVNFDFASMHIDKLTNPELRKTFNYWRTH